MQSRGLLIPLVLTFFRSASVPEKMTNYTWRGSSTFLRPIISGGP